MIGLISRRGWLGLLGLVWLGMIGQGQAWERPPLKIHTQFQFKVEVTTQPQGPRPTAPWYAYFPADPRLVPRPQTTPYPPWPMQFPPPGPPSDLQKRSQNAPVPGPMLTQHWPNYYAYTSNVQPVGYTPAQAPSYWYQGR
jgi:hypothetical protein